MKTNINRNRLFGKTKNHLFIIPVIQLLALSPSITFATGTHPVKDPHARGMTGRIQVYATSFQQTTVKGKVVDGNGNGLGSVEVRNLTSNVVALTQADGSFSIVAAPSDKLQFRLIGFLSQVKDAKDAASVTLQTSLEELDEVVVVGYGTQKKVNLTGSVASVKIDEAVTSRSMSNVSSALQGLLPGLAVSQNSGMAGNNAADLMIRGLGTVNNAGPLIVVDGMPDVSLNRININDVESVSVLKDAASASVYGSRAANGVILITTKTGNRNAKPKISASGSWTLVKPTQSFEFLSNYAKALTATQRAQAATTLPGNFQFKNGTIDQWLALSMIDPKRYPNTDWWDVILRDGKSNTYNVSVNGGGENSNYYVSFGALDEKGIQIENDFKRYNAAFNFDLKVTNTINTGVKFSGNWSKYHYNYEEGMTANSPNGLDIFTAPAGILPFDPVTGYYGGAMAYNESSQSTNPYADYLVRNRNTMNQKEAYLNGYLDWKPFQGFTAHVDYSLKYNNRFDWRADLPTRAYNFQLDDWGPRIYVGNNEPIYNIDREGYKTQLTGRLNYERKFGDHDLSVMGAYSEEFWSDRYLSASRGDRLNPLLHEIDGALNNVQTTGGSSDNEGLRSYIGRIGYIAFNKYLLETNFRVDGSSKFLKGDQYGFFPSASAGWRFTEESFFSDLKSKIALSTGKLRASYGALGNNSGVGRYEQQELLTASNYISGGVPVIGLTNKKFINYNLTWERTNVLNLGMDLVFFNNRLSWEVDYYDRLTKGMNRPSDVSIHLSGAYIAPRRNIGDMRNRGVESNLTWTDRKQDFQYMVNFNFSKNSNRLLSWNEQLPKGSTFLDMPYNFVYAFESLGIAQTWEDVYKAAPQGASPGDVLIKDVNGDGKIDINDRVAYPKSQLGRPSTNYALRGSASWKGFDFAFLLQGATGRKEFWMNRINSPFIGTTNQAITEDQWNNTWNLDNRDADYPRLLPSTLGSTSTSNYLSTHWLQDLSYLRVKNIQLGYTFSNGMVKRLGVNKLRVYGSADNLAVITSFKGLDPEKSSYANDAYPITKTFVLGLNVEL